MAGQVMARVSAPPVGVAEETPPAVGVATRPGAGLAGQATEPGVRVAERRTKPASPAGMVNTSWNTTPGTADGPSLR